MAGVGEIIIRITGDAKGLQVALTQATRATKQMATQVSGSTTVAAGGFAKAEKSAGSFFSKMGEGVKRTLVMGIGFAAFYRGLILVNQGIDGLIGGLSGFDRNMRNVQSITKQSDESLARMSTRLLDMVASGDSAGKSAEDLSDALYDIASSGFEGAAALTILEVAAQGAAAGLTTTKVSAEGLVAILNAYKLPVSEADNVMSVLFATVDKGIITFEELQSTIGLVIPVAASLDIGIEELGAAVAVLTRQGQQPSRVMTNLGMILSSIIKPTNRAREEAKKLGIDMSVSAVKSKGFPAVLSQIAAIAGDNTEALARLFPRLRAIRGILPLAANGGREFAAMLEHMSAELETATAHQRALAQQQKSLSYQMQLLGARIQAIFIKNLRPFIIWLASALPKITGGIGAMFGAWGSGIRAFKLLPTYVKWFMKMAIAVAAVTAAVWALSTALMALAAATPIIRWITLGLMGLTAGLAAVGIGFDKFKFQAEDAAKKASGLGSEVEDWVRTKSPDYVESMDDVSGATEEAAGKWEGLKDTFEDTEKAATSTLITLEKLSKQFPLVAQAVGMFDTARDSLKALGATLESGKKAVEEHNRALIRQALSTLSALAPAAYAKASSAIETLFDIHEALTEQYGREQRSLAQLEDEYESQTRVVDRYQKELEGLEDKLSKAERAMRDLLSAPLRGEEMFARGMFEVDQAIAQLELQLLRTSEGPGSEERRAAIKRELTELRRQREELSLQRQLKIGPQEFEREVLARRAEGEEAPGGAVVSAMREQLAIIREVTPQVMALESILLREKEVLEGLEGPLERQTELVTDLGDAVSEISGVMDTFKTSLKEMVDFALARLQELVTGGGAAGAGGITGDEFVEGLLPGISDVEDKIAAWAALQAASVEELMNRGLDPARIMGGLKLKVQEEGADLMRELITLGVEPAEAARMVQEQYAAAFGPQGLEGSLPMMFQATLSSALAKGTKAGIYAPETAAAIAEVGTALQELIAEAEDANMPEMAEHFEQMYIGFVMSASDKFKPETFAFLSNQVAENILEPRQLRMALMAAGVSDSAIDAMIELLETSSGRDVVVAALAAMGAGSFEEIEAGLEDAAARGTYATFWTRFSHGLNPLNWDADTLQGFKTIGIGIWTAIWDGFMWALENLFDIEGAWNVIKRDLGNLKDKVWGFEILPGVSLGSTVGGAQRAGGWLGERAEGIGGFLRGGQHGPRACHLPEGHLLGLDSADEPDSRPAYARRHRRRRVRTELPDQRHRRPLGGHA